MSEPVNPSVRPAAGVKIPSASARGKDPVCGMSVDPQTAARTVQHSGANYYFCSLPCAGRFTADPEKFLAAPGTAGMQTPSPASAAKDISARAKAAVVGNADSGSSEKIRYTCPMHPEIIQLGPGSCPKCGMALEPMDIVAGEEQSDPEYDSMGKRFWIAVALSAPLLILSMVGRSLKKKIGLDI